MQLITDTHRPLSIRCLLLALCAFSLASTAVAQDQQDEQDAPSNGQTDAAQQSQDSAGLVPINLQPQWEQGQTSRYELWTRRSETRTMTAGGQQRESTRDMLTEREFTWEVVRVNDDGSAVCEMTMDWIRVEVSHNDGTPRINDSRDGSGDDEAIHDTLNAMTGRTVRVEVASDGSIENVSGTEAIRQAIEAEPMRPEDRDFIESAASLAVLFGAPQSAGIDDQWQTTHKWTHEIGYLHEDVTWTLAGVERIAGIPVATITSEADLEIEFDRSQLPDNAPPIDVRLRDGSQRSQVMFDLQRHEAIGRNTMQQLDIAITINVPQQTINQRLHQTVQSQVLRITEEDG